MVKGLFDSLAPEDEANDRKVEVTPRPQILYYRRNQHPVGHGGFHSGHVQIEQNVFRYIYDCVAKKGRLRDSEINAYLALLPDGARLDLLFISHFHADHVNGLNHLLASVNCDGAVIPYLRPFERLCLVAADASAGTQDFDRFQFILDPVGWLGVRGVGTIIVASGEEGGPSFPGPGPSTMPNDPRDKQRIHAETDRLKPISPKQAGANPIVSGAGIRSTNVYHLIHTTPLLLREPSGRILSWEFLTYVHPADERLQEFQTLVRNQFPQLARMPQNRLRFDTRPLIDILQASGSRDALVQIFRRVFPSLNATSLCLYSGPSPGLLGANTRQLALVCRGHGVIDGGEFAAPQRCRSIPIYGSGQPRCGWLGTGDSELSLLGRRNLFLTHYRQHTDSTAVFVVPHHGSQDNFHEELTELRVPVYSVAAPLRSTHHPHPEVIRSIQRAGCSAAVTTERPDSGLCECGALETAYRTE